MMLSILETLLLIVALVFLFGMTILIHEFGHYLAARLCGLVVDVFSIGFGPAIWKTKRKGIVYKIGALPLGGYVALPQLDPGAMSTVQTGAPEGAPDGEKRELPPISAWKKIIVSLAGSVGNVVLAVIVAWIVYWVGVPSGPAEFSAEIGYVVPESAAYAQGLRVGDRIVSVDGRKVGNWREFRQETVFSRDEATLEVRKRGDGVEAVTLPLEKGPFGYFVPGLAGRDICMVGGVEPMMSAAAAGIRRGDVIVEFGGVPVYSPSHLVDLVESHAGKPTSMKVRRQESGRRVTRTFTVTPTYDPVTDGVRIGIQFSPIAVEPGFRSHPTPCEQLRHHAGAIFRVLSALLNPNEAKAASGAIGGPLMIIMSWWLILQTSIMLALWFTGFININLAIVNLLPIPVFDGGHIFFALWTVIFRKPVNRRVLNFIFNLFTALIILLAVFLSVRDVDRFTPVGRYFRKVFGRSHVEMTGAATNAVPTNAVPAGSNQ